MLSAGGGVGTIVGVGGGAPEGGGGYAGAIPGRPPARTGIGVAAPNGDEPESDRAGAPNRPAMRKPYEPSGRRPAAPAICKIVWIVLADLRKASESLKRR